MSPQLGKVMNAMPRGLYVMVLSLAGLGLGLFPPSSRASGPYQFHALTPCRVFDTRDSGVPLANPGPHAFKIQEKCGVPLGAAAVALNVTVTRPTQAGDLRLFPTGQQVPLVSTLNYGAGEPALANGAIVPLAALGPGRPDDLAIQVGMMSAGTVHVLLDVTGYFQ